MNVTEIWSSGERFEASVMIIWNGNCMSLTECWASSKANLGGDDSLTGWPRAEDGRLGWQ